MATVTKSIGTSSRDYSTITLWEADLDDTLIYSSGDDAVGECYNDSTFDESVTINGGGTAGLSSVTLTVAETERHDGTAGSGARNVSSSHRKISFLNPTCQVNELSWLEWDDNGGTLSTNDALVDLNTSDGPTVDLKNLILHGAIYTSVYTHQLVRITNRTESRLANLIVYDLENTSGSVYNKTVGISLGAPYDPQEVYNCTVHNMRATGGSASAGSGGVGFGFADDKEYSIRNCIATDCTASGVGIALCFQQSTVIAATLSNNLSSDATASGTGSLTNKTSANQFVSTVGGSEDLHLKSGADAIGAGVDLAATPDGVQYDINGSNRNALAATVWDIGAHQYASTASIGTSSRDYSTITLWEADLDDTTIYGAGANAVGECYNDTAFDESATINGGNTVGLSSVKLSVANGERHDGTEGTGARFLFSIGRNIIVSQSLDCSIEWLEIDGNLQGGNYSISLAYSATGTHIISNCILHGTRAGGTIKTFGDGRTWIIQNNIAYDFISTGNYSSAVVNTSGGGGTKIYNCTFHDFQGGGTANTTIITVADSSLYEIKNVITTDPSGTTTGSKTCISPSSFSTATVNNNLSSDSTASGTGSKTNQPASRQFVSTLSGSEDLHLIFKSAAIDAGVDLGTTPDGVQYDINGKDRDTENSIWDIGAHEYGDNVVFGLLRV